MSVAGLTKVAMQEFEQEIADLQKSMTDSSEVRDKIFYMHDSEMSGAQLRARADRWKTDRKTIAKIQRDYGVGAKLPIDKMVPGKKGARVQVCVVS